MSVRGRMRRATTSHWQRAAGLPYEWLTDGTRVSSIPYLISTRAYHSYRALFRRDSAMFFGAERSAEVAWITGKLSDERPGRLLEIGNVFGPRLLRWAESVVTIDLDYGERVRTAGWEPVVGDARLLALAQSFDAAVSVSTLEHVGMGHYGDERDPEGDVRTVQAIYDALRPDGTCFVTVPFGVDSHSSWQRLYDIDRIKRLFRPFGAVIVEFYHYQWIAWRRVRQPGAPAPHVLGPLTPEVTAIACISATKQIGPPGP